MWQLLQGIVGEGEVCEVVEMREVIRERAQLVVREVQSWGGGGGTMLRAGKDCTEYTFSNKTFGSFMSIRS